MGALLIVGLVVFAVILIAGVYVMSRRSPGRPSEDVQPNNASNQRKIDTLEDLHVQGQMKTHQYETMKEALDPQQSQEEEELKDTE